MRRALLILLLLATVLLGGFFVAPAQAQTYVATRDFIQAEILAPHDSVMTGEMVMAIERWYGVPAHITIAIWGAESSLGDPDLGGRLVSVYNVGCIRAFSGWQDTKWGCLARGTIQVAGKTWLAFSDAWAGAMAWGRYMKVGVNGYYRAYFDSSAWTYPIARVYYGEGVPGFGDYLANLRAIDNKYIRLAARYGFGW
jgi:hypothetical protein